MRKSSPNHIWRKSVAREWLVKNETQLQTLTAGQFAVIDRPARKRVVVEAVCANRNAAARLLASFGGRTELLPRDWLERYSKRATLKPIRVGARLLVVDAPGSDDGETVLVIPAGAAFGTGEHATTAMSLRMLERVTRGKSKPWRLLDAGTGSGILALAAVRFGASEVIAIDHDPLAISTARENARANRIDRIRFLVGDVKITRGVKFDYITANLYADLLVSLLPCYRKILAASGALILSGVLRAQEDELRRALRAHRFEILETRRRGKWIAVRARPLPAAEQKRG